MANKEKVLLDPHFRRIDEIFDPADLACLHEMADVIWGRDEPMPEEVFAAVKNQICAIITGRRRHGPVVEWKIENGW